MRFFTEPYNLYMAHCAVVILTKQASKAKRELCMRPAGMAGKQSKSEALQQPRNTHEHRDW